MGVVFGVLAFFVIFVAAICLVGYLQEAVPHKINGMMAKAEMDKFWDSEAANYASEKIVQTFGDVIAKYPRRNSEQTLEFSYSFSVSTSSVSSCFCKYKYTECEFRSWDYYFDEHRYPRLNDSAERTALGNVIANKAIAELQNRFSSDVSGSHDVSLSYGKFLGCCDTTITIYYRASNARYEELKSWG